jgi:serine/threonine protein kinase
MDALVEQESIGSSDNLSSDKNDLQDNPTKSLDQGKHDTQVTAALAANGQHNAELGDARDEPVEDSKDASNGNVDDGIDPPLVDAMNNSSAGNPFSASAFTSDAARKLNMIGSSQMTVNTGVNPSQPQQYTIYGRPVHVNDSNGTFPNVAAILGPYFCLGQLGKGTFSSIHKCIDMQYHHTRRLDSDNENQARRRPVVAAKVELGGFQQSGVLESEAIVLDYLYRHVQPVQTVPTYVGHYRSDKFAAILMEFLPGEDMHQIRERVMALSTPTAADSSKDSTRRMAMKDAVFFTADVMLPLLRSIHEVGVVHRDVKPSNCVRKVEEGVSKEFCMVDFGLSKSIIVPEDSEMADKDHPWDESKPWMKPLNYTGTKACFRKERTKADFRGTSMYASLRVHQGKDYCPRDDMWSLLYVFCDLVSGGLPWMSMAANRDRSACHKMKEWVHGEGGDDTRVEHIDELLKGDAYHIAKYKRERQKEAKVDTEQLAPVPEPLELCHEHDKVFVLRDAFNHLANLQFWDTPDYTMIQSTIRYFAETDNQVDPPITLIDWSVKKSRSSKSLDHRSKHWWNNLSTVPEWELPADDNNRLEDDIFEDADLAAEKLVKADNFLSRLPMELRYQLAQLEYNIVALKDGSVPMHRALHDWMRVILPLLHHEWDARKFEDGGHRTATDGFKRARYLELLQQCEKYAKAFQNFQSRECYYEQLSSNHVDAAQQEAGTSTTCSVTVLDDHEQRFKRRKVVIQQGAASSINSDMILVSKTLFGLERAIKAEIAKKTPPPVRISFG